MSRSGQIGLLDFYEASPSSGGVITHYTYFTGALLLFPLDLVLASQGVHVCSDFHNLRRGS